MSTNIGIIVWWVVDYSDEDRCGVDIDTEVRQSQLHVVEYERGGISCLSSMSISTELEAVGVLVVVLGMEEGFAMPCWTRRR